MTETTYEPTPEYSLYWLRRQDGVKPPPPFHDGHPQPGLYRTFGDLEPVRIIELEGKVLVLVNEVVSDEPNQVWLKCGRNDVSFEAYNHRVGAGRWPGASPGIGDNKAPELPPEDALPVEVEKATEWLATVGELKSDVEAHNAANRAATIAELRLKVEKIHKEEKAPHKTICDEVDARYLPKVKTAQLIYASLKAAITRYDVGKRVAIAKQEKIEALAHAKAAAANAAPPSAPIATAYGNVGRKVSVKAKPIARIIDQDTVYQFFKSDPVVVDLLQKLAQRSLDSGIVPTGVESVDGSIAR